MSKPQEPLKHYAVSWSEAFNGRQKQIITASSIEKAKAALLALYSEARNIKIKEVADAA